ncbi:MAG: TrgA family protein [Cypionkella sp.]
MPTASKLAAAVAFALVAFFTANAFATHMPEGSNPGWIREVSALTGAIVGWLTIGRHGAGNDTVAAAGAGIRTSLLTAIWVLLGFSIYLMIRKSMRMMYDGPMDAVLGIFDVMIEQGKQMGQVDVLAILGVGGAVGGIVTRWAGRRWR